MAATVEELQIEINSKAQSANTAIDKLVDKLDVLSNSIGKLNVSNFSGFSVGVKNLSSAMQGLKDVKLPDYSRLAKGIEKLSTLDSGTIMQAGTAIGELGRSLKVLDDVNVSDNAKQIADLAKGISQLGYKSATQAVANIPQLATAMKDLMATLSTAPKVSQNLIDMTNALANLARTGASSGRAANSIITAFNGISSASLRTLPGLKKMQLSFGRLWRSILPFIGITQLFRWGKDAVDIASSLTEVQNVVDVTFGKYASLVEEMSKTSIGDFGMSELTVKQVSSRFQAVGSAMGFAQGEMADMSIELTKLTADMASFYNMNQEDVAKNLQSIFTGETEPLRKYGLDITNATLQQWALNQGIDASVQSMSQLEKATLRYQYVMAQTGAAQGDFARTADTWANQVRVLKQQFQQLGAVVGGTLINALKPLVKALNNVMSHIIAFAQTVSNALGKIFGWKFEVGGGGVANDLETGAGAADDIAGGMDDAAKSAKKLRDYTLGIDELNIISPEDTATGSGGSGGGSGAGGGGASGGQWVQTESLFKEFESEIDTLYELGEHIRDALIGAMESIQWESVYEKARNFGTGLAQFLNGLFAGSNGKTLFGEVGRTIASALNTAIYAALSFGREFDFEQFGYNIADGINNFFATFDFVALASTLNIWVDGLISTIREFVKRIKWEDIIGGLGDFLGTLQIDTVSILIGAFTLRNVKAHLVKLVGDAIKAKLKGTINLSAIWQGIKLSFGTISFASIASGLNTVFSAISPGMLGELSMRLEDWLEGTIFDPYTWEGLPGLLVSVVDSVMWALADGIIYGLETIKDAILGIFNWSDTMAIFESAKENFKAGGLNIGLGILEGLVGVVAFIIEPIENIFTGIWNGICDVFGINSPAESMKPLGVNIFLGIVEGFKSAFGFFTEAITLWWTEKVTPWFTWETWALLFSNIGMALQEKWAEVVAWWNESALVSWWTENVQPWFTIERWKTLFNSIKTTLKTTWDGTVKQWATSIKSWWDNNVAPWFTAEQWTELLSTIPDAFSGAFKGAANAAIDFINGILDGVEDLVNGAVDALQALADVANNIPGVNISLEGLRIDIPSIPKFALGGFPDSASLFWAGENGIPELMGTVGGRTAVAGGAEITGIADAVYQTGQTEAMLLQTAVSLLQIIADKEFGLEVDGRELVAATDERRSRNGWSFT